MALSRSTHSINSLSHSLIIDKKDSEIIQSQNHIDGQEGHVGQTDLDTRKTEIKQQITKLKSKPAELQKANWFTKICFDILNRFKNNKLNGIDKLLNSRDIPIIALASIQECLNKNLNLHQKTTNLGMFLKLYKSITFIQTTVTNISQTKHIDKLSDNSLDLFNGLVQNGHEITAVKNDIVLYNKVCKKATSTTKEVIKDMGGPTRNTMDYLINLKNQGGLTLDIVSNCCQDCSFLKDLIRDPRFYKISLDKTNMPDTVINAYNELTEFKSQIKQISDKDQKENYRPEFNKKICKFLFALLNYNANLGLQLIAGPSQALMAPLEKYEMKQHMEVVLDIKNNSVHMNDAPRVYSCEISSDKIVSGITCNFISVNDDISQFAEPIFLDKTEYDGVPFQPIINYSVVDFCMKYEVDIENNQIVISDDSYLLRIDTQPPNKQAVGNFSDEASRAKSVIIDME